MSTQIQTESRNALKEFIALLTEIDERWCSEEWNLSSEEDITGSHRALMHMLEAGLLGTFEQDARNPTFRRIVTPSRKVSGDNADAIYFDAPISSKYAYAVHGNTHGSAYCSMTVENKLEGPLTQQKTDGVINDTDFDIDEAGNFTVFLGGEPRDKNWLPLNEDVARVTTRHYFEQLHSAANDRDFEPRLRIECLSETEIPEPPNDASVASGIRRICDFMRSRTLQQPPMINIVLPDFVAITPNEFPAPVPPGNMGLAAFDAHYSMAPFFLDDDEALVITGRWPTCRFANVSLWNRFQQTYDYANRQSSLNRAQTQLEDDGSFKIVLANEDPGVPNWMDTEGNAFGMVFWRFFLVEGAVQTPQAEVVKISDLKGSESPPLGNH